MQPCLILLPTTKGAERVPLCRTRYLAPIYVDLMTDTILFDILLLLSAIQSPVYPRCQRPFQSLQKPDANRIGIQHLAR